MDDLTMYENGLEEAKKIVAAAMKMSYAANDLFGLGDGWLFLNFLVRKAEEEYEEYKDRLQ